MWYIILSRSLPEKEESKQQHYEEHRQWLDDQHQAGRLLFSGPTADRAYGIYIMLASSKSEAERIAAQDPHHVRRHSNHGSVGMERPSRLSAERSHDHGRGTHGNRPMKSSSRQPSCRRQNCGLLSRRH